MTGDLPFYLPGRLEGGPKELLVCQPELGIGKKS